MGRPLSSKYFGHRNTGTDGNFGAANTAGDAGLGGQSVNGISVGTAGSYNATNADALTLTFPAPSLSGEGAVSATGTPNFKTLTATISGTQTRAYPVAAGALSIGSSSATSTYTATVTSAALASVAYASATTISFNTTGTAMISGTSVVISGASITGTMTIGGVAIAAGQTYYVGAPTTTTAATLYATYSNAVNATSPLTISNGTTTGATFTFGTTYGTVTAVTVVSGGSIAKGAVTAYAVATTPSTADSSGSGLQITPATFGLVSSTITQAGDGYVNTSLTSYTITATTVTSNLVTLSSVDEIVPGMQFTAASTVGGITGSTVYYVATVSVANSQITLADTYAHAIAGTNIISLTTTTAQSVATTIASNLIVLTSSGAATATATLTTAETTGATGSATTGRYSAILSTAWVAGDSGATEDANIIKQSATRRYKVETPNGTSGVCTLVTATPTSGQMTIQATDSAGGTYYVSKLTAHKATLVPITGTQFASGATAGWNFSTAVVNVSVVIDNG